MTTTPVNEYPPHHCQNPMSWAPEVQAQLDAATTEAELAEVWDRLESAGEVDMRGGAEWRHALAHLHYRQAGDDEDEEEFTDECVRAKWTIDGATTLAEAAEMARQFADHLQGLHDQGYVLRDPVADDYGFYYKPEAS